jgi:hypothetical protein
MSFTLWVLTTALSGLDVDDSDGILKNKNDD